LVAFDGEIAAPLLLVMAVVTAASGRARWAAIGFGAVAGVLYRAYAPPQILVRPTELSTPDTVSILVSSVLLAVFAAVLLWPGRTGWPAGDERTVVCGLAAVSAGYGLTTFSVTAGVLIGGPGGGFFAGHMIATICWIAAAAALFGVAARRGRADRSLPIGAGLALVAAATAKLFLFDLGTLDGIFRVVVFIVTGLLMLGMGAGYARLLAQQDARRPDNAGV
jgi:uncharacterized membrane protein